MKTTTIRPFLFGLMALSLSLSLNAWASGADVYTYDKLNRLTKILYSNGVSVTYDLDPAGNMISITNVRESTLAAQAISFGESPTITVGGTGIVSASATSGLPVTFRNVTTSACSMVSNGVPDQVVVTGVTASLCAIGASQAGNSVYAPAPEVLQSFSIAPGNLTTPSAPTITSVEAGPGRITINFTAPTSTGGAAIVGYTAYCTAVNQPTKSATGPGTASSLVVVGLTGGVSYTCALTAYNGAYTSAASTTPPKTPARAVDLIPILMLLLD